MIQPSLRQLQYFVTVAEELSFRRAAERLFITQPPLSRQVRALEEALGVRLLDRDRSGVRLTDEGRRFLADAKALLCASEQVVTRLRPAGGAPDRMPLRLGITTVVDVGLFAGLESMLEERLPDVQVNLRRQISARSIRDLHLGRIDAAVIGLPSRVDGLAVEHLFDEPMVACLSSRHRSARRRRISLLDLQDDPLFWFERKLNPAYHDHCLRVFARSGYAPRRVPEPSDHHVLLGLVAEGQGVALVPRSLRGVTRQGVVFKALAEGAALGIRVGVAHRAGDADRRVAALISLLKALAPRRP